MYELSVEGDDVEHFLQLTLKTLVGSSGETDFQIG